MYVNDDRYFGNDVNNCRANSGFTSCASASLSAGDIRANRSFIRFDGIKTGVPGASGLGGAQYWSSGARTNSSSSSLSCSLAGAGKANNVRVVGGGGVGLYFVRI